MKKILFLISIFTFSILSFQSANADPTYAMLDANGNVTNVIVCGSACAGGTFAGQKVVLQVAENPVTHQNAGGIWQGPNTTTYNDQTGIFTVRDPQPTIITNSFTDVDGNNNQITMSAQTTSNSRSFSYQDTVNNPNNINFTIGFDENSPATVSVIRKLESLDTFDYESLTFTSRKTSQEILIESFHSQLSLINAKIQTLIKLLGGWVK